jgi:molybdate transport system substrate-binding protein
MRKTMKTHRMIHRAVFLLSLVAVLVATPISAFAQPETLTIAAANSLKDALRKLLPAFESQHPEVTVRVIYGPSQSLRKQIEEGAPVDVFLPSLSEEIDQLERKGLVIQGTKRIYAGTSLVLITGPVLPAPVRSIDDLHSIPVRRIAVGDPNTSSVGKVAVQFLKFSKLDPKLKSQYIYGEHSRAVLELVAKGEAEIGVVYRTDAVTDSHVRILDAAPADSHSPIHYGVAIVWTARNISAAGDFIELTS